MNQFDAPPMSPDELAILASLAGPLFAESRNIEKMTSDNTVIGGHREDGSMKIRNALEQAQHLVRAQIPPPPQPIPAEFIQQVHAVYTSPTAPIPDYNQSSNPPKPADQAQLEFSFDTSNQSVTNDLLREISKKLTKLIILIEKSEKEDTIPKLTNQRTKHDHVKQTQT